MKELWESVTTRKVTLDIIKNTNDVIRGIASVNHIDNKYLNRSFPVLRLLIGTIRSAVIIADFIEYYKKSKESGDTLGMLIAAFCIMYFIGTYALLIACLVSVGSVAITLLWAGLYFDLAFLSLMLLIGAGKIMYSVIKTFYGMGLRHDIASLHTIIGEFIDGFSTGIDFGVVCGYFLLMPMALNPITAPLATQLFLLFSVVLLVKIGLDNQLRRLKTYLNERVDTYFDEEMKYDYFKIDKDDTVTLSEEAYLLNKSNVNVIEQTNDNTYVVKPNDNTDYLRVYCGV